MDVEFHKMSWQLRDYLLDYAWSIKKPTSISLGLPEWAAIDKWFLDNFSAKRKNGPLTWTFSDKEKYVEFCLKWM